MTYNDLCEEIKELGFETALDSPARLFLAAKRALSEICSVRPIFRSAVINQRSPKPTQIEKEIFYRGDGEIAVQYSSARAFSFKSNGSGRVTVKENGTDTVLTFSGPHSVTRGFLHGDGELVFDGDYAYAISDVAFYGEITSSSIRDIPTLGEAREYDMSSLTEGFIGLAEPPTDSFGNAVSGVMLRGCLLTVPENYTGDIHLVCKCIGKLSEFGSIEIAVECESLLALLTASYYWLDDDAEKAQYYHALYREGMREVRYYNRTRVGEKPFKGNGWA